MDLDTLFHLLMEKEAYFVLVRYEHGGVAGLVTTQDVFETLVGTEIVDGHDQAEDLQKSPRRVQRPPPKKTLNDAPTLAIQPSGLSFR